jgi:DNA-binding protein HU-beta
MYFCIGASTAKNFRKEEKMTKSELVAKMAEGAGITKAMAEKALNNFVSAVSDALTQGDKITLVGFGTFDVAERAQREGRNPRTGKTIVIPASKVVKFRPGSKLRDSVK